MVNKTINNIQDIFLNNARKNRTNLTVHLLNGFKIKVILECDENMMLIYKHSISTITPEKPIPFINN